MVSEDKVSKKHTTMRKTKTKVENTETTEWVITRRRTRSHVLQEC